ncbi:MAG: hypothetical protein ACYC7E_11480 [Armatimonadota bacterium]
MGFEQFQNPPTLFRPAPFWSTNDRLTPEESARQMRDFIAHGFGGAFFHSRMGLISEYLGEEWFAAVRGALQGAKEAGGYLWLYDEDCWPSGGAGGLVTSIKDEYRSATLRAEWLAQGDNLPPPPPDSELRAAYRIQREGRTLLNAERIPLDEIDLHVGEERLIFRRYYAEKAFGCWGWESCVNWLNPEATAQFIALTHERYRQEFGEEFGKSIPGIFTDEPILHQDAWHAEFHNMLAWYDGLPACYGTWHGRDFWADLPYFCFDGPECRKIRLLLHRTVLRQFCEAFSKPISDWCERHNLPLTGHYCLENDLVDQVRAHNGGIMAHYRYLHIPGVDQVGTDTPGHLLAYKQVSSAARQLGKKQVLSELFGGTGHTFTFEDFKSVGDYNLVHGVTFFCPHLSWYSCRGLRKRDFPPNWNYQQTYWDDLPVLLDYFSRIGAVLAAGEARVDILLLHPIEDATAGHRLGVGEGGEPFPEDLAAAEEHSRILRESLDAILTSGRECDLGDEGYLADLGSVEGNRLRVGAMAYRAVVVPPARTWRPSTYALLKAFAENGGLLIFLGAIPEELDAEPACGVWEELATIARSAPNERAQLQQVLDRLLPAGILLRDADGHPVSETYLQHRTDGEQEILFILNANRTSSREYVLTLKDTNAIPTIWEPLDGSRRAMPFELVGNGIRCVFALPPTGSLLLVLEAGKDIPTADPVPDLANGEIFPLPARWEYALSEENVLVLDRIAVSPDGGGTWWEADLESRVRERLTEHFDIAGALRCQPWAAIRKGLFDGKGGEVILRYPFRIAGDPPEKAWLVIEDLQKGALSVNGISLPARGEAWQWDRGFGKVEVSLLLQPGENTVDFRVDYSFLTEVERAYLVGNFGVRLATAGAAEIVRPPQQLTNGSWVEQGFPFYSGRMRYRMSFHMDLPLEERLFLRLKSPSGILFRVRVNGHEAAPILWQPYQTELTDYLIPGENALEIEVVASRQNTMGPIQGDEGYLLHDYGLLAGAELVRVV